MPHSTPQKWRGFVASVQHNVRVTSNALRFDVSTIIGETRGDHLWLAYEAWTEVTVAAGLNP